MGQTDIYKLRWPERTGVPADGPDGYQDLATDVENQMIRMRSRTFTNGFYMNTGYVSVPPGQTRTLLDLNLTPPVAGWVQVEWFWSCQWKAGTWHGGRTKGILGVPGLVQSTRVGRWANYGFAQNGMYAGRLANPTLNRLGQRFQLICDTDAASDPNGVFQVCRVGYCIQYYGGNPVAATNSYQIGHADYIHGMGTAVTTYTITPEPATAVGDWMYFIHLHYREFADITPTMPAGWTQVIAPQLAGTLAGGGLQWGIWRKKRAAGDTSYTVTLSSARVVRASIITVRQPNDNLPTLSAFTAARGGLNPARVTVPGGVAVQPGALVLSVGLENMGSTFPTQPPTVTGGNSWYWVGNVGNERFFFAVATRSYTDAMNTDPVVFNWNTADVGQIGGISMIFPPA